MSGNGPKYSGLLRSLAARHGCSLEYSLPELVSGGLTPPPSRVYPSTVCYMVTVQIDSSSYLGFGPTPMIARHAAEFEAYRSVNKSLSTHGRLPPAITKPASPMPNLEAESWVASELDDDIILGDDIQNTDSAVRHGPGKVDGFNETADSIDKADSRHERGLNGKDDNAPGEASTSKLCAPTGQTAVGGKSSDVTTPATCKKVSDAHTMSSHAGCRGPPKYFSSSTVKGVTQNRAHSSSNRVPMGRNENFCEIPQQPCSDLPDIDGLMQALINAPTDTDGEGAFRFAGTEKKDITDLALQAAQQRGLNMAFKVSVVGPPFAKQVLVTAVCGNMRFEGRHSKKKVARDIASKKLLDALGEREQQQRGQRSPGRSPGRSPQGRSSALSDSSTSGFVSASHVMDPPPSSGTSAQPSSAPRRMARREGVLGPAFSLTNIQQSSSSECESDGAHSVMSLPISTLRQRATGRGLSHNPIGQLQELMMKEQHCLPVYAEGVESVGKYTEYICVVSAKGLSAKGVGCSKKLARRHAAENMLAVMEEEGMTTNPSLIDNRFRKLMRPSSFRSKLATRTSPHPQPAFEHQQTPTPSPPSPSSPPQRSLQATSLQPSSPAAPLQSNSRTTPPQPNPQVPPLQRNLQVQPNAQEIPHEMNLPCQQQQTSPQQSNPEAPLHQQQRPHLLNRHSPPRQPNQTPLPESASPGHQTRPRQQSPQVAPCQPNPHEQTRQQAPPLSARFPNTHSHPPSRQRSNRPFSPTHSRSPKSRPKQHSRWQPRSPMHHMPMGPEPYSFPPFGQPHVPYGPPPPACGPPWPPQRPSCSQVPGIQHPPSRRALLRTPPYPGLPSFPRSPPPRVPPNFQRLHPPKSLGPPHPDFQGPHRQPQGPPSQPRTGMRPSPQVPNCQGNPQYPSKHQKLQTAASQSQETHSTASSQQANQATNSTTISPTMCAFAHHHPPVTSTDSENESDPELSLQVSPGLFEMLPPRSSSRSSNLINSVRARETMTPELLQENKIAKLPNGDTPVQESVPDSAPISTSVTSVDISQTLVEDATTGSPKGTVSAESKEPLTIPETEDSKQTEVTPNDPSQVDTPPLHKEQTGLKELDCIRQKHLPVHKSNSSNTETVKENDATLITQYSCEAKQPLDSAVKQHADDAVPNVMHTPTSPTPAAVKVSALVVPEGQSATPVQEVVESSSCTSFAKCATVNEMMASGVLLECVKIGKVTTQKKDQHSPEQNKPVKSAWAPMTQQLTPHFNQPHSNPLNFSVRLPRERQQWSSTAGISKEALQPKPTVPPWVGTSPKPCLKPHPHPHPSLQMHLNPRAMQALGNTSQTPELPVHPLLLMSQSETAGGIVGQQQDSRDQSSDPTSEIQARVSIAEALSVVDSDVCAGLPSQGSTNLSSILK